ncbi:hypothetical protein NB537_00145 [Vibrio parahaemolyticus]|nr:hypothetical protein [Vibrio parahaemolyticus]MCR9653209.1 hypothetical protein [Vibrio parahaemolyticus]
MRFEERIIEVVDSADFYFDPVTKMITKEYHKEVLLRKRIIHFICYFSSGNKPFKALSLGRSLESAKNFILYFGSDSSWIHYYATKPHKDYVALAVKGEYSSPRYIKHVYLFLEAANDRRAFDHCKSFEDLRNVNI